MTSVCNHQIQGKINWWILLQPKSCLSRQPAAPSPLRQMLLHRASMKSTTRTPHGDCAMGEFLQIGVQFLLNATFAYQVLSADLQKRKFDMFHASQSDEMHEASQR